MSDTIPVELRVVEIIPKRNCYGGEDYLAICESVRGKYKKCLCRHELALLGAEDNFNNPSTDTRGSVARHVGTYGKEKK